ncbi:MAG: UDP-glucose/GDP-mannose dehydrogenase family protein [Candidatus Firestonebacteria bacterium]
MKIAVVGVGYVGLVASACFAKLRHEVIGVDSDESKIKKLSRNIMPIYEPGLEELVKDGKKHGRLRFTADLSEAVKRSDVIFICVNTPPKRNGGADLSSIERVCAAVAGAMTSYKLIVGKSTVPVKTGEWVRKTIKKFCKPGIEFDVASNPEFLREGTAIQDFLKPDRIVIGVDSEKAKKILLELYKDLEVPKVITDVNTSEMIKHAANSFLAMKISYINALANICEKAGADVNRIAEGMGYDKRIMRSFLNAGPGYGGFCFPKDVLAFIHIAGELGYDFHLLKSVDKINREQKRHVFDIVKKQLKGLKGKKLGVLGIAFKPNTDDIRFSPAVEIIEMFKKAGASVSAFDPEAMENAKETLKGVKLCRDKYSVCKGADALVILTDWEEFKAIDLKRVEKLLKHPVIIDARNLFDPEKMKARGFIYKSIGRS